VRAPDIDTTVLLVDDEEAVTDAISAALEMQGFTVTVACRGADALSRMEQGPLDVVILDVTLPDSPGIKVCRAIRQRSHVPILMISGGATETEVIAALEAGADDYLVRPFGIAELVARIRAALRRASPPYPTDALVQVGPLTLAPLRHRAWLHGQGIELPDKEFGVLEVLVRNPGRVVTRASLVRELYGSDSAVSNKALDATVRRLRQKLGDARQSIVTVRGVGFRLEPPS
jgi:two-component system response regulator RegX3